MPLNAAVYSNANSVIVVLGASEDLISKEIDKMKCSYYRKQSNGKRNGDPQYELGLNTLMQKISPLAEAVIFMVCDQPYASSSLL